MAIRSSPQDFSPIENEPPIRLLRRLGLVPTHGLGTVRRAVALALFTWLPLAGWALAYGRALPGGMSASLADHYGITVCCLVAIPLLVLGETAAQRVVTRLLPQFVSGGLLSGPELERFDTVLRQMARLRDHSLPWVLILGATMAVTFSAPIYDEALNWARLSDQRISFGGAWFLYVARPIYLALLLSWFWRLVLMTLLCHRIARLNLSLVPTHPDRSLGLGFLDQLPEAFGLWGLAMSAVVCARWTHELVHLDTEMASLRFPFLVFVGLTTLLMVCPLLPFAPKQFLARRQALRDYSALVGRHGRLVRQRWIEGRPLEDADNGPALLEAPELGPIADTTAIYLAVEQSRRTPISRQALVKVLLPLLLPALIGVTTQIPLTQMIRTIGKALL